MPETKHFRCPLCGMVAPLENLDNSPYQLQMFIKSFGGKVAFTNEQRELLSGTTRRGGAPGRIVYDEIEVPDELFDKVESVVGELAAA